MSLDSKRSEIKSVLEGIGINPDSVMLDEFEVTENFPAATIAPRQEIGQNKLSSDYEYYNLKFAVFIHVEANDGGDPYKTLYELVQAFKSGLKDEVLEPVERVDFYTTLVGSTKVKTAKMEIEL